MRVISGTAGRLQLEAPKSMARPSTDRLREALFSILGNRTESARALDLFAGSGALGIEALSRGANQATFVDQDRAAIGRSKNKPQTHAPRNPKRRSLIKTSTPSSKGLQSKQPTILSSPTPLTRRTLTTTIMQ